jgi:hypothetical protein
VLERERLQLGLPDDAVLVGLVQENFDVSVEQAVHRSFPSLTQSQDARRCTSVRVPSPSLSQDYFSVKAGTAQRENASTARLHRTTSQAAGSFPT